MYYISNADRWRFNIPAGPAESCDSAFRRFILGWMLVMAILVVMGSALAHGATPRTPGQLVMFTTQGCVSCEIAKPYLTAGVPGYETMITTHSDPLYAEFTAAVPQAEGELDPQFSGALNVRPRSQLFPVFWIRGTAHYWQGFTPGRWGELREYLAAWHPSRRHAPNPAPSRSAPVAPQASHDAQTPHLFDGVHVVVTIGALSDQRAELRAELARRANRTLQELTRSVVGEKAGAHLVAQVAEPAKFEAVTRATGVLPGANGVPVTCTVLIPERYRGLQGFIVKQVESVLDQHFLVSLQSAGISVILERIHGETYGAVLEAITETPAEDGPAGPFNPENGVQFMLAAWLSERSDLARRLLSRLGWAAA